MQERMREREKGNVSKERNFEATASTRAKMREGGKV